MQIWNAHTENLITIDYTSDIRDWSSSIPVLQKYLMENVKTLNLIPWILIIYFWDIPSIFLNQILHVLWILFIHEYGTLILKMWVVVAGDGWLNTALDTYVVFYQFWST